MARPKSPRIDRKQVIEVALEMIDRDGLGSFSVERLGERLGVRGPSLYHHFRDRAELLRAVARLILLEMPDPRERGADATGVERWDQLVIRTTLNLRRTIMGHPKAAPLVLQYFPRDQLLSDYEWVASVLQAQGVPARLHLRIYEGLEKLALGSALYWSAVEASEGSASQTLFSGFPEGSDSPSMRAGLAANRDDPEALFTSICETFLDGIWAEMSGSAGCRDAEGFAI